LSHETEIYKSIQSFNLMKAKLLLFFIAVAYLSSLTTAQTYDTFTDPRDGEIYQTVQIGDQIWMAENLRFFIEKHSKCYDFNDSLCEIYGRVYTWRALKQACPEGWRVPIREDFLKLVEHVESYYENAFEALVEGGSSGFNMHLGGITPYTKPAYLVGMVGKLMTSEYAGANLWGLMLNDQYQTADFGTTPHDSGHTIRCLKD